MSEVKNSGARTAHATGFFFQRTCNFSETAIFPTEEKGKIISFDNDGELDLN